MRTLTWAMVVVVAVVMMGCAPKREELPQMEPADVTATAPAPTPADKPTVIETPAPMPPPSMPARVEKAPPRPALEKPVIERPPAPSTYTVKKDDTLSSIARNFLGDAKAWRKIYEANRNQIKNPDRLQVGMVLTIPPK